MIVTAIFAVGFLDAIGDRRLAGWMKRIADTSGSTKGREFDDAIYVWYFRVFFLVGALMSLGFAIASIYVNVFGS